MSAFDELTLGEVEELTTVALGGKSIEQADGLMLAGGVMWITRRHDEPSLTWDAFKQSIKMSEIKAFSVEMMNGDDADPLQPPNGNVT